MRDLLRAFHRQQKAPTVRTISERFWAKVAVAGPKDCWEWQRSTNSSGYGQFKTEPGKSPQRAHRVAWLLSNGDPGALCVLHRCDNLPCCNPAHLFLGTRADNQADMFAKGRERINLAALVGRVRKLTDDQIIEVRRRHASGESNRSIARRFDVYNTTIDDLINGDSWSGYPA